MRTEAFDHRSLGDRSYLVADERNRVAAVIDPQREIGPYVERAKRLGCRIVVALETHLHNDFVSGARRLAEEHGVEVVASSLADLAFSHRAVGAGDVVVLGDLRFEVVASPGHTLEHLSYLVRKPHPTLFAGGALAPGGAARIDLFGPDVARVLAEHAYRTLRELLALPPETRVLPTHVGGSFCAAGSHGALETTIEAERASNRIGRARDSAALLAEATRDLPHAPSYYPRVRELNRAGATAPPTEPASLSHAALASLHGHGAVTIVDTRGAADYHAGHVRGSLAIGLDGSFAPWAAWLTPTDRPIAIVADRAENAAEAARDLGSVGRDDLAGYVLGTRAHDLPLVATPRTAAAALEGDPQIVDVRWESEWRAGHIPGALHATPDELAFRAAELSRSRPIAVHCASGYRSRMGASILERLGFTDVGDLGDGLRMWRGAGRTLAS